MQRVIGFRGQLLARQYQTPPCPKHLEDAPQVGLWRLEFEVWGIQRLIDNLAFVPPLCLAPSID